MYDYKEFEKLCRKKFGKKFHTNFEKKEFSENIPKTFDLVSEDGKMV